MKYFPEQDSVLAESLLLKVLYVCLPVVCVSVSLSVSLSAHVCVSVCICTYFPPYDQVSTVP